MTPKFSKLDLERELCRRSLAHYVRRAWPVVEPNPLHWNWHLDLECEVLEAVLHGEIRNVLFCVPPGTSKSLLCSTLAPSWAWIGVDATLRFIAATYGQDLSDKNAKLHLDLVKSEWYQERFGRSPWGNPQRPAVRIPRGQSQVRSFKNSAGGWRFTTSVGGALTGRHADVLIWDDLLKAQDADNDLAIEKACNFLFKVLPTRRADPRTTRTIGVMQRLNDRDPAGQVIQKGETLVVTLPMEFDPDRKAVISLPPAPARSKPARVLEDPRTEPKELLDPERFTPEVVASLKATLGPTQTAAQLQQDPVPPGGLIFQASHFARRWTHEPQKARRILFMDCTFKDVDGTDFVVIQKWAAEASKIYLLDEHRDRWNLTASIAKLLEILAEDPKILGVYIEDKANGSGIISTVKDRVSGVVAWSPGAKSKVERANAILPVLESGEVYFPPDDRAPWFAEYQKELVRFPKGTHDDRVDATTMALGVLGRRHIQRLREAYSKAREALGLR